MTPPPATRAPPRASRREDRHLLARLLAQVGDDVGAVLGQSDTEVHALAGDQALRVGEPRIERLLLPHHGRALDRGRVAEVRRRARLAAVDAAMCRADP